MSIKVGIISKIVLILEKDVLSEAGKEMCTAAYIVNIRKDTFL